MTHDPRPLVKLLEKWLTFSTQFQIYYITENQLFPTLIWMTYMELITRESETILEFD